MNHGEENTKMAHAEPSRHCADCDVSLPADKPSHRLAGADDLFCSACIEGAWKRTFARGERA